MSNHKHLWSFVLGKNSKHFPAWRMPVLFQMLKLALCLGTSMLLFCFVQLQEFKNICHSMRFCTTARIPEYLSLYVEINYKCEMNLSFLGKSKWSCQQFYWIMSIWEYTVHSRLVKFFTQGDNSVIVYCQILKFLSYNAYLWESHCLIQISVFQVTWWATCMMSPSTWPQQQKLMTQEHRGKKTKRLQLKKSMISI